MSAAVDHRTWVQLRRIDRKLGRPVTPTGDACLEHERRPAAGVLRGIGPLCAVCLVAQRRAEKHAQRRPRACGCGQGGRAWAICPLATRLWRRARVAYTLLVETPEADQARRGRLATAYTSMMLGLGRHMGEG